MLHSSAERPLDAATQERHLRQLIYFSDLAGVGEGGEEAQRRLGQATVVVLGVGGLGC